MEFSLQSLDDTRSTFVVKLAEAPIRIGQHPGVDIQLDSESVSRFHCQIDQINGTLWVRDLGSTQGIFVNGFHVAQSHLMPGDRLTVGTMSFRVDYERKKSQGPAEAEVLAAS